MKIRKKPVTVDGWPIKDLLAMAAVDVATLPGKVQKAIDDGLLEFDEDRIAVVTLEGVMVGWPEWWLICGVQEESTQPGLGLEGLDAVTVRAPDNALVSLDLLLDGGNGPQGGDVLRLSGHVVKIEGGVMFAVTAVDAAPREFVGDDPVFDDSIPESGLLVLAGAVCGVLLDPSKTPLPASLSIPDSGGAGSASTEVRTVLGFTLGRELLATLDAGERGGDGEIEGFHDPGYHFYPCDPDVIAKTYDVLEPGQDVPQTLLGVPITMPKLDPYGKSPEL